MSNISQVEYFDLEVHSRNKAQLSVANVIDYNLGPIMRFFSISSKETELRGFHAHKLCNQLIQQTQGLSKIIVRDSENSKEFEMKEQESLLLIPRGIWVEIEMSPASSLVVLCDQLFNEEDYIRNWSEYLEYKKI